MHKRRPGGDPPGRNRGGGSGAREPGWEYVHAFLQVVEHGSFRSAALRLGLPINRLRQRVARLEQQLGVVLLTRHVDGVRATAEGEQVLAAAREMESAYFGLMRAKEIAHPSAAGQVKLAVPEGLGTFWLAPRLAEFHRTHPNLAVDLRCAPRPLDMLRLEADVAVQLIRPSEPDLKVIRLGRLHMIPYAAASYIETHGTPRSVHELSAHRLVVQVSDHAGPQELFESILGGRARAGVVCVRTNASGPHALAIASGAGIGWLATYASAIAPGLVPIELEARAMLDIWLTCHADAARIPRVREVIDWAIACFDPRRYPWFRDAFVHPREFTTVYRGEPLFHVSGHFAEDEVPFIEFPGLVLIADGPQRAG